MKAIKKAVVKTGEYTANDGTTKGRYTNVGKLFKREDGSVCLKLDAIPLGVADVWVNFYELDKKQEPAPAPPAPDLDDAVPF